MKEIYTFSYDLKEKLRLAFKNGKRKFSKWKGKNIRKNLGTSGRKIKQLNKINMGIYNKLFSPCKLSKLYFITETL